MDQRCSFELFKSNVCHRLKERGDVDFIIDTLEKDEIRQYYDRAWYAESLYLLAMLDYVSRLNDIPLCARYEDLRACRLQEPVYPASVLMVAAVSSNSEEIKEQARRESIPEFSKFNIIECDIRNIV